MKLSDVLRPQAVIAELTADSKKKILEQFAELASSLTAGISAETVFEVLSERENLGSTAVGHGIAIPHGKLAGIPEILVLFGRSQEGVDFNAHDNNPTHLFFVLLAPENAVGNHLQTLARLSRLLKEDAVRQKLISCPSTELYETIVGEDSKL